MGWYRGVYFFESKEEPGEQKEKSMGYYFPIESNLEVKVAGLTSISDSPLSEKIPLDVENFFTFRELNKEVVM